MKKTNLKTETKAARKQIESSLITELKTVTSKLGEGKKKLARKIEKEAKKLSKKIAKQLKLTHPVETKQNEPETKLLPAPAAKKAGTKQVNPAEKKIVKPLVKSAPLKNQDI